MFKKIKNFSWKIQALILATVVVICGVGIGFQIKRNNEINKNMQVKTTTKEIFNLNEDCEIWSQGRITAEGDYESPKMLGIIPKDLLNRTKEEIVSYIEKKYPDKEVSSMNKYEIILSNEPKKEPSKANKYSIEDNGGIIYIYKYDDTGKKIELEKTDISVDSLPKSVQDDLHEGILVNNEDDAYEKLENFES